mmetsp:Transcript_9664/g.12078  ORF Transcript_9664/g.12078 Transcript_9664/m.12078 type:complete len:548 (+) Transcript_9664:47-1690(+)
MSIIAAAFLGLMILCRSQSVYITLNFSNITNPNINPYIFGINMYDENSNTQYTSAYTIVRNGGEAQSRFNWEINALNDNHDWYFISDTTQNTWQQNSDPPVKTNGMDLFTQIPAMGWVAKSTEKQWSFSQAKYGAQQSDECTNFPGATWCAKDAGNGVLANGQNVVGNDPNDADKPTTPQDAFNWVQAIIQRYGDKATIFGLDNEPCIWHTTHRDVHPIGATYDELWNMTLQYGTKIKEACNYKCQLLGLSNWGWCGYFTSGYDNQQNINGQGCFTGTDREAHGNLPLLAWYLQQNAMYETQNGKRLLDILDVHYYPQNMNSGTGITFNCNEDSATMEYRLQSPRALYDWNYVDPTWINQPIALIPRLRNWIDTTYPGTNISISEHNFGGDTCITSVIAHAEVLSIAATYGVEIMTRWVQPDVGTPVINSYNIYTNYDGKGSNIYGNGHNKAYNVMSNNIESVTGYTFAESDASKVYVYLFNKDKSQSNITIKLNNGKFTTNGIIDLYVINNNGLTYMGQCNNKPNSTSFSVVMSQWTVMFAIINQN